MLHVLHVPDIAINCRFASATDEYKIIIQEVILNWEKFKGYTSLLQGNWNGTAD